MKKIVIPIFMAVLTFALIKVYHLYSKNSNDLMLKKYTSLKKLTTNKEELHKGVRQMTLADIDKHIESLKAILQKYQEIGKKTVYPFENEVLDFMIEFIKTYKSIAEEEKNKRAQKS